MRIIRQENACGKSSRTSHDGRWDFLGLRQEHPVEERRLGKVAGLFGFRLGAIARSPTHDRLSVLARRGFKSAFGGPWSFVRSVRIAPNSRALVSPSPIEAQDCRASHAPWCSSDPILDSGRVVARGQGLPAALRCKAMVLGIARRAQARGHCRDCRVDFDPLLVGVRLFRRCFCDLSSMAGINQETSNPEPAVKSQASNAQATSTAQAIREGDAAPGRSSQRAASGPKLADPYPFLARSPRDLASEVCCLSGFGPPGISSAICRCGFGADLLTHPPYAPRSPTVDLLQPNG